MSAPQKMDGNTFFIDIINMAPTTAIAHATTGSFIVHDH